MFNYNRVGTTRIYAYGDYVRLALASNDRGNRNLCTLVRRGSTNQYKKKYIHNKVFWRYMGNSIINKILAKYM